MPKKQLFQTVRVPQKKVSKRLSNHLSLTLTSPAGIEPTAFRLGGERSILLSYEDILLIYSTTFLKKRQGFYFDFCREIFTFSLTFFIPIFAIKTYYNAYRCCFISNLHLKFKMQFGAAPLFHKQLCNYVSHETLTKSNYSAMRKKIKISHGSLLTMRIFCILFHTAFSRKSQTKAIYCE